MSPPQILISIYIEDPAIPPDVLSIFWIVARGSHSNGSGGLI
jgi:hypothetical protein